MGLGTPAASGLQQPSLTRRTGADAAGVRVRSAPPGASVAAAEKTAKSGLAASVAVATTVAVVQLVVVLSIAAQATQTQCTMQPA